MDGKCSEINMKNLPELYRYDVGTKLNDAEADPS